MGSGIARIGLTIEGLVFMAIGTVGLLAGEDERSPFLPEGPLTNFGLLVLGLAVAGAAQQPGPRRVVAWVQAIGFTAKLVSAAAGDPTGLPWHAAPSALVGTVLLILAVMSLSAAEADSPPTQAGGQQGRRPGG
jgi:peptidoglycan/LPS O-acetylase OafA/YrhL